MNWEDVDWPRFARHMALLAAAFYLVCLIAVENERYNWENNVIQERPRIERRGGLVPLSDLGGYSNPPGARNEPR